MSSASPSEEAFTIRQRLLVFLGALVLAFLAVLVLGFVL